MICPKCKQDRAHRSHRTGLKEHFLGIFGYYAYRCRECGERRLMLRSEAELESRTSREVIQTKRRLRWKRTQLEVLFYGGALLTFLAFLYYITRQRQD